MKQSKKNTSKKEPPTQRGTTLPQQAGKELIVPYTDVPVKRSATKKIHDRPTPPPLPKGPFVQDADVSPSLDIE